MLTNALLLCVLYALYNIRRELYRARCDVLHVQKQIVAVYNEMVAEHLIANVEREDAIDSADSEESDDDEEERFI